MSAAVTPSSPRKNKPCSVAAPEPARARRGSSAIQKARRQPLTPPPPPPPVSAGVGVPLNRPFEPPPRLKAMAALARRLGEPAKERIASVSTGAELMERSGAEG